MLPFSALPGGPMIEGWPVTDYETLVANLDSALLVLAEDIWNRLVTRSDASATPDAR